MKNIVLTGFMGTGKTTIGTLIAKKLGRRFIDIDAVIVDRENRSISDIFENDGETYFRSVEKQVIAEMGELSNSVIATGGGAVLNPENIANLRKNGVIVNLRASAQLIAERTSQNNQRPLLSRKSIGQIEEMLAERESYYNNNDFSVKIDGQGPLVISDMIISTYRNIV